jgi:hypothetical protein
MAGLARLCRLNLYKGNHAHSNYVLPGLIFDNDELFDSMFSALQVVGCEVCGCPHRKLLHGLQVGERGAFLIEDALPIHLNVEEVSLHLAEAVPHSERTVLNLLQKTGRKDPLRLHRSLAESLLDPLSPYPTGRP